jgi:hypothetical protein
MAFDASAASVAKRAFSSRDGRAVIDGAVGFSE